MLSGEIALRFFRILFILIHNVDFLPPSQVQSFFLSIFTNMKSET